MTNMHLAPPALFMALVRYLDAKEIYWDELDDNYAGSMHNQLEKSAEGKRINEKFEYARSDLSTQISIVYRNLKEKLRPPSEL